MVDFTKKSIIVFLLMMVSLDVLGQDAHQVIKGIVLDADSKFPLPGANVVILDSHPLLGASSDSNGLYRIERVPLGRHSVKVSFLGYKEAIVPNVLVHAGKETIINVQLEEMILVGEEIVVVAEKDKHLANNEMATVSARSFNVEETKRYAGSLNDPARMAANFAGVSTPNDSRNDIIIRGNSPGGLLWRLEGIDIPSPNHFSSFGTTGGPVSMLNNNLLDKSDFFTGAFPAQYGNALAGVFDLNMRNGNRDKREYMAQAGFNGFEFGAEGPFSKNSRASYLINYRHSQLEIFKMLGMNFGTGTAVPSYNDLSLKVDMPTKKAGRFTVFALGGASNITFNNTEKDSSQSDFYSGNAEKLFNGTKTGVLGASHTYFYNPNTYSKLTVALSGSQVNLKVDSLVRQENVPFPQYRHNFRQSKLSANLTLNKKFNAKNNFTSGILLHQMNFNLVDSTYQFQQNQFYKITDSRGNSMFAQAYLNWQHKFSEQLVLNAGLHLQQFFLNNSQSMEPRAGIKYHLSPRQAISFGFGRHSQMQPLQMYFLRNISLDTTGEMTNFNLDFTRSNHYVLAYDYLLLKDFRLKLEAYYQTISEAPVSLEETAFSMLNAGAEFGMPRMHNLVNTGKGRNYGVELTLEKFYSNNYYFLTTISLFESSYKGSDGMWRNTAFNSRYVTNFLAGKEFNVGKKNNSLSVDWKLTTAGGRYLMPVGLEFSRAKGETVYFTEAGYSEQLPSFFRTDLRISFRENKKKFSHEFSLDVQNVLNTQNVFTRTYNKSTGNLETIYQLGIFPIPQYRLFF